MSETALLSMPFAGAVPMTASRVLGLSWYSAPGITQRDGKPAPQIRRTKIMSDNRKYYYLKLKEEIRALTKQASEKTYIGGLTKECVDAFVSMVYLYDDQTMKVEFNCEDVIRRALEKYGA